MNSMLEVLSLTSIWIQLLHLCLYVRYEQSSQTTDPRSRLLFGSIYATAFGYIMLQ